jgi:hypothetical protein
MVRRGPDSTHLDEEADVPADLAATQPGRRFTRAPSMFGRTSSHEVPPPLRPAGHTKGPVSAGPVLPPVVPIAAPVVPPNATSVVAARLSSTVARLLLLRRSRVVWFGVALLFGVVLAGTLVANGLQPDLAAQVRASALACPPASSAAAAGAVHPAASVRPAGGSVKAAWTGTCQPPVVSVWELPVAQDSPPVSPRTVRVKKRRLVPLP